MFVSFALPDAELRKSLDKHLGFLSHAGAIKYWSSAQMLPGAEWQAEFHRALAEADVALLLLSVEWMDEIGQRSGEFSQILEEYNDRGLHVIPILLRACAWQLHPWLGKLTALPRNGKAIDAYEGNAQAEVLKEVVEEIARLVADRAAPSTPDLDVVAEAATGMRGLGDNSSARVGTGGPRDPATRSPGAPTRAIGLVAGRRNLLVGAFVLMGVSVVLMGASVVSTLALSSFFSDGGSGASGQTGTSASCASSGSAPSPTASSSLSSWVAAYMKVSPDPTGRHAIIQTDAPSPDVEDRAHVRVTLPRKLFGSPSPQVVLIPIERPPDDWNAGPAAQYYLVFSSWAEFEIIWTRYRDMLPLEVDIVVFDDAESRSEDAGDGDMVLVGHFASMADLRRAAEAHPGQWPLWGPADRGPVLSPTGSTFRVPIVSPSSPMVMPTMTSTQQEPITSRGKDEPALVAPPPNSSSRSADKRDVFDAGQALYGVCKQAVIACTASSGKPTTKWSLDAVASPSGSIRTNYARIPGEAQQVDKFKRCLDKEITSKRVNTFQGNPLVQPLLF